MHYDSMIANDIGSFGYYSLNALLMTFCTKYFQKFIEVFLFGLIFTL